MAKIIVSYDDTDNDRDALALGRALSELGGEISLAYGRHTQQPDQAREALEEKEAEELLRRGAEALGDESIEQRVVVHASTGTRLREKEAAELLRPGAEALGDESIEQRVVVHASTGTGLWELAESKRADVIVFGSDHRPAEGAGTPRTSPPRTPPA